LLSRRFSSLPDHDHLVQETYVRLRRVSDPQKLVHARAFLFTTARNLAIDHVCRTRRTPCDLSSETAEIALLEPALGAADILDHAQRHEAMLAALGLLPARCHELMLLRSVDGFSAQEIAAHLGRAIFTTTHLRWIFIGGDDDCRENAT
jgi:RNA polymerase sigma-70 factor (ECF subfamily)